MKPFIFRIILLVYLAFVFDTNVLYIKYLLGVLLLDIFIIYPNDCVELSFIINHVDVEKLSN